MGNHLPETESNRLPLSTDHLIICACDLRGNLTFLNHSGEQLLGYSCEEVRGLNVSDLVGPDTTTQMLFAASGREDNPVGGVYEIDIRTRDGRQVPLEVSTRVVARDGLVEIEAVAVPSVFRAL